MSLAKFMDFLFLKQNYFRTNPDYYLRDYPSQVILQFCHNHIIDADACFRNVRPLTELHQTFQTYYQTGHSPFSALVCHKCDLHSLYGPEFYNVVSSNFMCPSYNWCCREYVKLFNHDFTCPREEELAENLRIMVEEYNKQCGSECAVLSDKCLTLCSPLMKRVFELGFAEDLVTVRCFTASKLAPEAHEVFLFLCHTPIGSLPFGIMLISGTESSSKVQQGISMLLQMLKMPSYSPKNIIIDENTCLYESLKLAFPQTAIIFNEFQMLQSIWRAVRLVCEDQQEFQTLYDLFVFILKNSYSRIDYQRNFNNLRGYAVKYPKLDNFLKYFNERANRYVLYCRPKAEFNIDMLNYTDSGTIILRDVAVEYSNHFNIVQLFDFLTKNYVTHYERKLKKIVDGDLKGFYKTNFYVPVSEMAEFTCEKITNTEFSVSLNEVKFFVNAELDTCTCEVGVHGGSCVHQYIVEKNIGLVPECYTPLGDDMLGIFKSILGYKDLNGLVGELSDNCMEEMEEEQDLSDTSCYNKSSGELDLDSKENDEKTVEIAEFLTNLADTRDESVSEVSNKEEYFAQYTVMENGVLSMVEQDSYDDNMVMVPPEEILDPPKNCKINILSTIIIKPGGQKTEKIAQINGVEQQDGSEIDSDTVEELASREIEGLTVESSDLVDRLSLAFSQLSELAATKKFQEPIEKFLERFQELASSDRLLLALENFGQTGFTRSEASVYRDSENDESLQFEHYSDCRSSCSEFHSELEEVDDDDYERYFQPINVQENMVKLPPGIRLTPVTEDNNKVQPRDADRRPNKRKHSKTEELEHILMETGDVDQSEFQSKPHNLLNEELSFLFNDPRFEAIVEDDPPSDQDESSTLDTHSPSPVALPSLPLAVSTGVVVRTLETAPEVVVKPRPSRKPTESPKKIPKSIERPRTRSQKPTKSPKVSRKKKLNSTPSTSLNSTKKPASDSDDSEILNASPLKRKTHNKRSRQPKIKKSNLELIVLLERNINIELLCKAKKSHHFTTKKKRRGYKELLESAKKIKYM